MILGVNSETGSIFWAVWDTSEDMYNAGQLQIIIPESTEVTICEIDPMDIPPEKVASEYLYKQGQLIQRDTAKITIDVQPGGALIKAIELEPNIEFLTVGMPDTEPYRVQADHQGNAEIFMQLDPGDYMVFVDTTIHRVSKMTYNSSFAA